MKPETEEEKGMQAECPITVQTLHKSHSCMYCMLKKKKSLDRVYFLSIRQPMLPPNPASSIYSYTLCASRMNFEGMF